MFHRLVEIKKQVGKFIANFSVTEEDGKEYIFDGEIIREGLDISTYDEKGDVVPLSDGEYTIKGVKVKIVDGKVTELPEKESKVEATEDAPAQEEAPKEGEEKPQEKPKEEPEEAPKEDARVAELMAQVESLTSENEALKAELKTLKETPMAEPLPQRTNMASQEKEAEVSDNVKGTKFEKACRIFGSNK